MNGKTVWIVGAMTYFFAFMGGLFLARGDSVTPAQMFIAGNILCGAMVVLVVLWRRLAEAADSLPEHR